MRESIGGISLFQIVILFVLLFTGIMCLTINRSKAFGVKDEIITIIQNEALNLGNGFELDASTTKKIGEYLSEAGYRLTGACPDDSWIAYDREGNKLSGKTGSFCLKANNVADSYYVDSGSKCPEKNKSKCGTTKGDYPDMVYYDIVLFYQLEIPVIKTMTNFRVYGSTKILFRGNNL